MTHEQEFEGIHAYLTVIKTHAATDVTITMTTHTIPKNGLPTLAPDESLSRSLNAFDVLNLETANMADDLTGSQMVTSHHITIFGENKGTNVPNTNHYDLNAKVCITDPTIAYETHLDCETLVTCYADHIEKQILPINT